MSSSILLGMFGMPGHLEMLIIAGIALLLFGHRLPSVMRSLGRGVVEFKKGVQGIEEDLDSATTESSDGAKPDDNIAKNVSEK
jgi:sec-independent protein translocase protein TatA